MRETWKVHQSVQGGIFRARSDERPDSVQLPIKTGSGQKNL